LKYGTRRLNDELVCFLISNWKRKNEV